MRIYKDDGKIVVEFMHTDVLFNNNEVAGPLVSIDESAMNDVKLVLPEPNENIGIVAGLNDEQYRELSEIIVEWLRKTMKNNPDQPFVITNDDLASIFYYRRGYDVG